MNRRHFLTQGCACGALFLAASPSIDAEPQAEAAKLDKNDPTIPVNPQQIAAVLSQIDQSGDKAVIDAVFVRWGHACFEQSKGNIEEAARQRLDFPGFITRVNKGGDPYCEHIDYDEKAGVIRLVGRKFSRCVCAYSRSPKPPKALCTHCCRTFQKRFFQAVTGRRAEIELDETVLLGGERCRTTVRLFEKMEQGS